MTPQEIKFRGFRDETNEAVYGNLIYYGNDYLIREIEHDKGFHKSYFVDPSSLGMFTGLTDKNGKEIYGAIGEKGGDVIRVDMFGIENNRVVSYVSQSARFHLMGTTHDNLYEALHDISGKNCSEIIGNQWEEK